MIAVLEHILSDPSPITYRDSLFDQLDVGSDGGSSALSEPVRSALERRYLATHDARRGGLLQSHKYLDWNTVEYGLLRARQGDATARRMARQTLEGSLNLIDPVWGAPTSTPRTATGGTSTSRRSCRCRPISMRIYAPFVVVGQVRGSTAQCGRGVPVARSLGRLLLRPGPVLAARVHAGRPGRPGRPTGRGGQPHARKPAVGEAETRARELTDTLTWPDPARDIRESPTTRSSARAVHPNPGG